MIIEVSSNNNTVVRKGWQRLRDCLVGLCINFDKSSISVLIIQVTNFPGLLFVSEFAASWRRSRSDSGSDITGGSELGGRAEYGEMWGLQSIILWHIRPPTPELGMGHMGQAGIKTCCLYICLIFLSSVILLTSFTIQWILYSIQFSLVSHIAFDFIKINGGNSRKGLVSWALLKGG